MLVSVVFHEGYDEELRARSLATVRAQTHADWEVVGSVEEVRGDYVAFLDAGDTWSPDRLARLTAVGRPLVADRMEGVRGNGGTVLFAAAAPEIEPARLLAERALVQQVEPGPAWVLDLLLSRPDLTVTSVDSIGVRRRFPDRRRALRPAPGHHRNAVLNRHLVDWTTLEMRVPAPGLTSVLVPTYEDAELTTHCVESLVAAAAADGNQIEVVVWDNGSAPDVGAALDELRSHPGVRVEHAGVNHGFALGNNLALAHAHGDLVVFLNNDTTVAPGWLTPLRAALAEPDVLAAQPLLVYPTGTIQSAGIVFPTTGGLPHELLQGFPVEDSADIGAVPLRALTGAALALRYADAVALRGFDPTYTNGLEDVDLCHRLVELRGDASGGHFRVVADVPVVHHESRTPGRFDKHLANRQVYLDRWRGRLEPRDDVATWATRGLRVVDHEIRPRPGEPQRLAVPRPLLVRESTRLRWAIKNPSARGGGRRPLGRHPVRLVARRRTARPGSGGGGRPAPGVGPGDGSARRRGARPARPGRARPEPPAGHDRLGHLPSRGGHRRGGPRLRPPARGGSGVGGPTHRRVGSAGRAAAAGHRP